jgi:hypothetical protein
MKNDEMHTRARDNALMSGRWNLAYKNNVRGGVGIYIRIPRLACFASFTQRTYARQKDKRMDGFVLSFIRTAYSKSEDSEEMPSCLATYAKAD